MLDELERRGYRVVPEVARAIIRGRKRDGLPPRPPPSEFARQILEADVRQYVAASPRRSDLVFFDRGIPDSLGMVAEQDGLSSADRQRTIERYPYHPPVFVLPPWREIYRTDGERDQTFEQAVRVHENLRRWYEHCGYDLLEVPRGSIDERCAFVLEQTLGSREGSRA